MTTIDPAILAAQQAYAARPFQVIWRDSHCQIPARFDTFEEAFDYVQRQWANIRHVVARERCRSSDLWRSWLETPTGRVQLCYVLLCDDVSSYR